MSQSREAFFECSYTMGEERRTAHVRAWTASEAEKLFREELAAEGVPARGPIVVAPERRAVRVTLPAPAH